MSESEQLWSDQEVRTLANSAYQKQPLRCPRCSAPVVARSSGGFGRRTESLRLACKRCGARATYSPDNLAAMELKWDRTAKMQLVEHYWAGHRVRCPQDGAVLNVIKRKAIAPPPPTVHFHCPHCGRAFWSSDVEKVEDPGSFGAKYESLGKLGIGGMGAVVLARSRSDGHLFAAKRILPKFLGSAEVVRRFQREGRILSNLSHPNVVPIIETFLDDSGGVIVMDYLPGGSLAKAINDLGVSNQKLLDYFAGLVAGVAYLHQQGIVHRDLKPENVLLDEAGNCCVSDFGLSRLIERDTTTLTALGDFLGTRRYAAPEQHEGARDVSAACDMYSLGLIAYEMAKRRSPFQVPISARDLKPRFEEVLYKYLAQDPSERLSTGNELVEALREQLAA